MATDTIEKGKFKQLSIGFEEALARIPLELEKEGFGVITEIDLQKTFKAKLGIDFRRYRIIGACNPGFAHQAVGKDPHVGLLLPCNVVLYERDDGKAVVGAIDPMQTLGAGAAAAGLAEIAADVGARLDRVLSALAA